MTLSFGTGHVSAAEAVAAAARRQSPNAEVILIDALQDCWLLFRVFYVWTYWAMIRYAPVLWSRFFASRVARKDDGTAPGWALRWGFAATLKSIALFKPDLIVACEVAASEIAVIALRDGLSTAKIVNVITDLEAEPIWARPEIDAYAVADEHVKQQLESWGADAGKINICGIPVGEDFREIYDRCETRQKFGLDERPVVLLMGGGMGPTRMDAVAANLLKGSADIQIVALPGRDAKARRRLESIRRDTSTSLHILPWIDKVAPLMQAADLLVTKPGGVTLAEAAVCGLPLVLFNAIPGPEETNARRFVDGGAAVLTVGGEQTADSVLQLLSDRTKLAKMKGNVEKLARPNAAADIATIAIRSISSEAVENATEKGPVLILTISNGAGGIQTAENVAAAIKKYQGELPVVVADVADYMTPLTRFTHITVYLWLVKHTPWLWDKIDRYQKKQPNTSPEWYYRRGCRSLFEFASQVRPRGIVATEVGCCEIGALIKRDLALDAPLVAVQTDLDADRAWIQPEVDLYCLVTDECAGKFVKNGAPAERVAVWGAPIAAEYDIWRDRNEERGRVCRELGLDPSLPLVLVSGGSEGLGKIEETVSCLLEIESGSPQIVVLTGRNEKLRDRCRRLSDTSRLCVLGWMEPARMPRLMRAADLAVSKLGNFFNEAIASDLSIVALKPPPGGEWKQYHLLSEWNIGRAVKTHEEMIAAVTELLGDPHEIAAIRARMRAHRKFNAGRKVADWLADRIIGPRPTEESQPADNTVTVTANQEQGSYAAV